MRRPLLLLSFFALSSPAVVLAGGFEAGENTALANARGGTGVASRADATATYFNPALLSTLDGFTVNLDANLLNENLTFQRDPLTTRSDAQTFDLVENQNGFFPIPFLAVGYGKDDFGVGLAVYGPHSYGRVCMTKLENGECVPDPENAARHMLIGSDLLEIFTMVGFGAAIESGGGTLRFGISGGPAIQVANLDLYVDQVIPPLGSPYTENPNNGGVFQAENLVGVTGAVIAGISYEIDNITFAVSARPSLNWESKGKFTIDLPSSVDDLGVSFTGDELTLKTKQAGSYRLGVNYRGGDHPADPNAARFDVEMNLVYEDWGKVQNFETRPEADLIFIDPDNPIPLAAIFQPKGYRDTYALRIGGSYAFTSWLTGHTGGFIETAAQDSAQTNADFASWERYAVSGGATFQFTNWLGLTVSYNHIFSPSRTVTNGGVFQQLPLSQCTGPDYTHSSCPSEGTPTGTPQNNGDWTNSYQTIGVGLEFGF